MGQLQTRTLSSQPRKRSNSLLPPAGWRAAGEPRRAGRSVAASPATVTARPRVIGQAGRRSYRRRQRETPIGAAWQGKTQWRKSEGGIRFLFHVPHPSCRSLQYLDTNNLYILFSEVLGPSVAARGVQRSLDLSTSPHCFPRSGAARAGGGLGGGAAREAGLRRALWVDVNVSVLHSSIVCRRHCRGCHRRCRNRRSLQPRASPLPPRTGEKQPRWNRGSPEGGGNGGRRAAGGFHPGRSWRAGSMCLLGRLPVPRWGSLPSTPLSSHIPRISTPDWRFATCHFRLPGETLGQRTGGGGPRGGKRRVHIVSCVAPPDAAPQRPGLGLWSRGGLGRRASQCDRGERIMRVVSEEDSSLLASLDRQPPPPPPPPSKTHTLLVISSGLCGSCGRKPDLIALWCLLRMFGSNLHLN